MSSYYDRGDPEESVNGVSTVEFFPSIDQFLDCESEDDEECKRVILSEWDVVKIGTFVSRLEWIQSSKQYNKFLGKNAVSIPPSVVLRLANEVFGYNGWSSELKDANLVEESSNEDEGRYSAKFEVVVNIKLSGGLEHEGRAIGRADRLPHKYMSFNKARRSAMSEATKWALCGLKDVLIDYELSKG